VSSLESETRMHCPSCRSEYRPGIERCSECGGELLPGDMPDPPDLRLKEPPPDPVTVFTSRDPALFPVARSILEGEEVPFFVRGEELQDLFGIGRLGLGFNPIVGPIEIQVSAADVERARELLAEVEPPETETEIEEADAGRADTGEADPASIAIPYRPPLASPLSRLEAAAPTAPLVASPRARNCFRFLVAAEAILTLGSWFIQPRWWREFPTALWNGVLDYFPVGALDEVPTEIAPFVMALSLMASIGLLFFSPQARIVYALVWGWWLVGALLGGPRLGYGLDSLVGGLIGLLGGAILALAFYGPIAEVFAAKKAAKAAGRPRARPTPTSPG
jgi:hypothetical protein